MPNDFLAGFETGQGIIDRYAGYKQQGYQNAQLDRELTDRETFHQDQQAVLKKELELREQRQKDLRSQLEIEMDIQKKALEWTTLKQNQHLEQRAKLVNMQKEVNSLLLNPAGPDFLKEGARIANEYSGLMVSDDPEIRGPAMGLAKQWTDKLNATTLAQQMAQKSRAFQNGFIQPGETDPKAGTLAQDMEDVYTAGSAAGVDLHDAKYGSLMEGLTYNKATGGLSDQSKAKFARVIESEKAARAQAVPDKETKITVGIGEPNDQGHYPSQITASISDILANPAVHRVVAGALASQGKDPDTILGVKADENGVPRIPGPNGLVWRWSQAAGRYVEYTPIALPASAKPAAKPAQRSYIGNNVHNLGNIVKGIFGVDATP